MKYGVKCLFGNKDMSVAYINGVVDGFSFLRSEGYKKLPKNQIVSMKKNIMFMMPALPGGGAEKVLIDILKNFDYASYEVTLFLEYKEGVYLNDVPEEVRILALHSQNTIWFERFHRVLRIFIAMSSFIRLYINICL